MVFRDISSKCWHLVGQINMICWLSGHRSQQSSQSWASPQIRNCGLTKNFADMRTCGLKQFKLQTCGCGLFLILVCHFASFKQILKFLSIFVKYLCFYPVKHEKSIKFFRVQFGKKIKFFEFTLT